MNKYIATIVAAVVVLGIFFGARFLPSHFTPGQSATTTPGSSIGLNLTPILSFTQIADTPVAIAAWATFQKYLAAAKAHDLKMVQSLSYQLSPECKAALADTSKAGPCNELMDSVYFFAKDFKQSDFTHVAYDEKQLVLSTDYVKITGADDPIKTVLYFVRQQSVDKILGIRFCIGKDSPGDECVRTAPDTRDSDKNGWWDDVERLFK